MCFLLSLFLTVDLNVPEQAFSIDVSFQPNLVAFAEQFFVFAPFDFIFRKIGQQPFPQVAYGFFAVGDEQSGYLRAFSHELIYRVCQQHALVIVF